MSTWYPTSYTTYSSPVGELALVATDRGLAAVSFTPSATVASLREAGLLGPAEKGRYTDATYAEWILEETAKQLDQYFGGERQFFALVLDLLPLLPTPPVGSEAGVVRPRPNPWVSQDGTFRTRAQAALLAVPYGRTWSYGQMAAYLGNPGAARAVGTACATNPLPIILPCHRITRGDGTMGHYTGGVEIKRALLTLEGGFSG